MSKNNVKLANEGNVTGAAGAITTLSTNSATTTKFALSNDPRIINAIEFRGTNLTDEKTLTKNPLLCAFLLPHLAMPEKGSKGNGSYVTTIECLSFEPVRDKFRQAEVKYKDEKGAERTLTTIKAIGVDENKIEVMSEARVIATFKLSIGTKAGVTFVGNVPATFVRLAENSSDSTIQVQFKANWSGRINADGEEAINLWVNSVQ